MQLNYEVTQQILDALSAVCDLSNLTVSTENTDWKGRPYKSDFVMIDKAHNIGFEAFDNEIITCYFDDHCHFEDNGIELNDGEPTYVQHAIEFLQRFFTLPLIRQETQRGNKTLRYEWFCLLNDGRSESLAGAWIMSLFGNPFRRKTIKRTTWLYSKSMGQFVRLGEIATPVYQLDWDILVTVHPSGNAYTYQLERYEWDNEQEDFYWIPLEIPGISLFSTEDEALQAGKAAARQYRRENKKRSPFSDDS